MIVKVDKYRIYCETDSKWVYCWCEEGVAPTLCPENSSHTIDSDSIAIIESLEQNEVIPVTPKNEHQLIPVGLFSKEWTASDYCSTIDLSNKVGKVYDYASFGLTGDPKAGDCVSNDSFLSDSLDFITAVDTGAGTITLSKGEMTAASGIKICRPLNIDVAFDETFDENNPWLMLWGLRCDPANQGRRDFADCVIVDKDGVGVGDPLNWYTQAEWDAIEAAYGEYEALHYERTYIKFFEKESMFRIPDSSPGPIYKGLYLRIKYYTTISSATQIDVIGDWIVTRKDA